MKTKTVVTLGPKSESEEMIFKLVKAGMDVARMNFSHCTEEEYKKRVKFIRKAEKKTGRKVKILADLQGPKIRVGNLPEEGVELKEKEIVSFSTDKKDTSSIFINDPHIHKDLKKGDSLFLADGKFELKIQTVKDRKITAKVIKGGILFSRKGVNAPKIKLTTSGLTRKDIKDAKFILTQKPDFIAISFVQDIDDILKLKKLIGKKDIKIISKIETAIGLENIDEIIKHSDAIMVARGDLGIEVPMEDVPFIQKSLIRRAIWHGKGSIVATQMLLSMTNHPFPTRAEVSDVANAVWGGADGVMLSDETASGQFPLEALQTMVKVVKRAEETHLEKPNLLFKD